MKRTSTILLISMFTATMFFSMISMNITKVAADEDGGPPFLDWNRPPDPPKDGNYWDFNNGTHIGWRVYSPGGVYELIYNITTMKYYLAAPPVAVGFYKVELGVR